VSLRDAIFDRYSIMARQRPALLMLFPALVGAVVMLPALQSWWATLLAVTGTCGVSMALSEFAQGKGKALEPSLIALWDKLPSVAMLRHRDDRLDTHTKQRYKAFLQRAIPGLVFPDAAGEAADPAGADEAYYSATRWLLTQTRDKRTYSLLFEWNISYGFRRNMLGLRRFGMLVSTVTLAVTVAENVRVAVTTGQAEGTVIIGSLVALAGLWFWITVVKPAWVEIAANGYARELLAACDKLPSQAKRKASVLASA
jgi:hypothetical protein